TPPPTLSPYTTLFRSPVHRARAVGALRAAPPAHPHDRLVCASHDQRPDGPRPGHPPGSFHRSVRLAGRRMVPGRSVSSHSLTVRSEEHTSELQSPDHL